MITSQDKAYIHFYLDIDGLIINLLTIEIEKDDLNERHKAEYLFEYCIKEKLIHLDTVRLMGTANSKLKIFSTIEGEVQIDINNY